MKVAKIDAQEALDVMGTPPVVKYIIDELNRVKKAAIKKKTKKASFFFYDGFHTGFTLCLYLLRTKQIWLKKLESRN